MSVLEPYWSDDQITLHLGECLAVLPSLPDESVDAVVCDPPYALTELPVATVTAALAAWLSGDRAFVPDGRGGFMGRDWDRFVPPPAAWDECFRVLKPGGHLLAFAAPRTADLMTLSIRLARFEIREGIAWMFAQGMPKSLDVSKAIDKAGARNIAWFGPWLRAERERRGIRQRDLAEHFRTAPERVNHGGCVANWELGLNIPTPAQFNKLCDILGLDFDRIEVLEREVIGQGYRVRRESAVQIAGNSDGAYDITAPATEDAARWSGWGTGLKPAFEPVVVARKPLAGTVVATVLAYGTGALNVEACRVGAEPRTNQAGGTSSLQRVSRVEMGYRPAVTTSEGQSSEVSGRWPPNVLLTHAEGCQPAGSLIVRGDHRTGGQGQRPGGFGDVGADPGDAQPNGPLYGDSEVTVWDCEPGCPVAELDRQSGVLTSGANPTRRGPDGVRGSYGEFAGQAECAAPRGVDSGGASRFFPAFHYQAKATTGERPRLPDGTSHPTVKPLPLVRWLVRLVTPPGGLVLDPYAGTGPTGEACIVEGFRCVLIDRDPKAVELIRTRLRKDIQPDMFGGVAS